MDNFEPCNVLLSIATNIPVLLMTAFVLQGHICVFLTTLEWKLGIDKDQNWSGSLFTNRGSSRKRRERTCVSRAWACRSCWWLLISFLWISSCMWSWFTSSLLFSSSSRNCSSCSSRFTIWTQCFKLLKLNAFQEISHFLTCLNLNKTQAAQFLIYIFKRLIKWQCFMP